MRVFVSSVRVSLELERDSLRGLIRALGHDPVMFEDFTAQPVPPREACLEGVRSCAAYVLLLGERYGQPFPETGLSPTAEEHVAARTAGIPRLVMRKTGVSPEPRQQELIEEVRSYRDGVFYNEFTDVADLQTKVVAALRQVEQGPEPLLYAPLPSDIAVDWRHGWTTPPEDPHRPILELHVVPISPQRVPSRLLQASPDRLAGELRATAGVGTSTAINVGVDTGAAWARAIEPTGNRRYDEPRDGTIIGCRVSTSGQTSVWSTLPGDSMGSILDRADLLERMGGMLRTAGAVIVGDSARLAIAVGIDPLGMVAEGKANGINRNRLSMTGFGRGRLAVDPDETVTRSALGAGSHDAAIGITDAILAAFRTR